MINQHYDLSVVVLAQNWANNLTILLTEIQSTLDSLAIIYEIILVGDQNNEPIDQLIQQNQVRILYPITRGYGAAIKAGIHQSVGDYVIVMDADQTAPAALLRDLWKARDTAHVIIASRYIGAGRAIMPGVRRLLSKLLNLLFSRGLDLRVRDMSSGFRLYKSQVIKNLITECNDYDILQEILVKVLMEGYRILEIPYRYESQDTGLIRAAHFGLAYLKTFARLWKLRNSIASADYDARAYDALMPPQRYWQRQRFKIITQLLNGQRKCLDVGCGSSRIIGALPPGSVALDILIRKLRYAHRFGLPTVQGSIFNLPVPTGSFPCILCSQVIEHVPRTNVFHELDRALQPGGFLILGTPDYAKWQWLVIEWLYKILLPQAYADEHISHYTYQELFDEFVTRRGYQLEVTRYILQGELILGLRKPASEEANLQIN